MKYHLQIAFFFTAMLFFSSAIAQKKDSTYTGYAEGIIKDSINNQPLQVATISVYKVADSSLVSYQLTNNFGEFHFRALPVATPLEIVISHIGYKHFRQKFIIPANTKKIDLRALRMAQGKIELSEVTVSYHRPPVQMNGDTLEFNAEAFKLDKNAVVEDLLRKLPGITIWGDGTITVNGKKVSHVLVDGKLFFGGDGRIATQNLPKDAIDKIQVYNNKAEQKSPLDTIIDVNIKLKKNKKTGLFGKVGAGYGTDGRYTGDGMISTFSPLTQISVVGATNNINTTANDVSTLMRNSSFKGVGVNIEYQPDFSLEGLNKSKSAGFDFLHFLVPDEGSHKNHNISANYFINDHSSEVYRNTQTVINLSADNNLIQKNNSIANSAYTHQNFNTRCVLQNDTIVFYTSLLLELNKNHSYSQLTNTSATSFQGLQSTSHSINDEIDENKNLSFKTGLENKPKHFNLDYAFSLNNAENEQTNRINFDSPLNPSQNSEFDRNYTPHIQNVSNALDFRYDRLKKLIFGEMNFYYIEIKFLNSIKINNEHTNNIVNDLDTVTQKPTINKYLTNISQYNTVDEIPELKFERTFIKALTNRYKKTIIVDAELRDQIFNQKNISQKTFQNFEYSYNKFIPKAGINYLNDQFGDHQITYQLDYNTSLDYPTVNQIAPLVDSANIFYQQRGNPRLKPSYKKELSFSITYVSFVSKNIVDGYKVNVSAGSVDNAIADSTLYDNLGRTVNYSVNVNESRYLSISGDFRKAYKFKGNQLQIRGTTLTNITWQPNYVNSILNQSNTLFSDNSLSLIYTLKDFFAIEVKEKLSVFSSKQTGFNNNEFKNSTQKTILSTSFNCLKKITLSSNITYNSTSSSNSAASKFTIWNANINYRFLKGNQAEVKFSALDLLHQNTSIINYGYNNSLTTGNVNVLKQYFMVTLAYFPRKFGKKEKLGK
jgi:hypothetical protein